MKRYKLIVAYDGTNYCGWQVQPEAVTIEGVLNETLSKVLKEKIQVIGASRTDAGVHAYGNVAVFDSETPIPGDKLMFAINPYLPEDVRIVDSCQVADDFHPRYCDTRKTYEYHIQNGKVLFPTQRLYSYWVTKPLDIIAMEEAGQYLVGTHDFKSFCSAKTQVQTTVRTVCDVHVYEVPIPEGQNMDNRREIIIRVEGEGFLYNMVRILAGTLIYISEGKRTEDDIKSALLTRNRDFGGVTLPPEGLYLNEVYYNT